MAIPIIDGGITSSILLLFFFFILYAVLLKVPSLSPHTYLFFSFFFLSRLINQSLFALYTVVHVCTYIILLSLLCTVCHFIVSLVLVFNKTLYSTNPLELTHTYTHGCSFLGAFIFSFSDTTPLIPPSRQKHTHDSKKERSGLKTAGVSIRQSRPQWSG